MTKINSKLEEVMNRLNKSMGDGSVMYLSEDNVKEYKRIPSGSYGIDSITGGGFPLGRMIELVGWESSGKSTVAIHAIANAQKMGLVCVYVDVEQAYDANYAGSLGVNNNDLIFLQPNNGEEALEAVRELISTGQVGLVVVDSVATLIPKVELEGEVGDQQMGLQARMMSKACRMISPIANKNDTCVIWINQFREKLGISFGDPRTTPGGNAMKFYASIRIELAGQNSKTTTDENGDKDAKLVKAKCIKNKTFPPFRECAYYITFGKGIDNVLEIVDMGVEKGVIKKSGSWYSYEDVKLGQGISGVKSTLEDNPELFEIIKSLI